MFYGVNETNADVWRAVRSRDFYFCDNSYFDAGRERFFRVTRNAIQHHGFGRSDGKRLRELGVEIKPWRTGRHVLVCLQSQLFMRLIAGFPEWQEGISRWVFERTDRPIRVRGWSPHKAALRETLRRDLEDAHCVVTWSSCAAVEAILAGVPVICMGPAAAGRMSSRSLDDIENPPRPEGREEWAAVLADNQWTLQEMREGMAWKALQ
jgi:hypothetical protein